MTTDARAVFVLRLLRMRYEGWLSEAEYEALREREKCRDVSGEELLHQLELLELAHVNAPRLSGSEPD